MCLSLPLCPILCLFVCFFLCLLLLFRGVFLTLCFFPFQHGGEDMFGSGAIIVSLGYAGLAVVFLPMGFLDLQSNVKIQYISFWVTLLSSLEFCIHFASRPLHYEAVCLSLSSLSSLSSPFFLMFLSLLTPHTFNSHFSFSIVFLM